MLPAALEVRWSRPPKALVVLMLEDLVVDEALLSLNELLLVEAEMLLLLPSDRDPNWLLGS